MVLDLALQLLPSVKRLDNELVRSTFLMGKLTISMTIFNSELVVYQGNITILSPYIITIYYHHISSMITIDHQKSPYYHPIITINHHYSPLISITHH